MESEDRKDKVLKYAFVLGTLLIIAILAILYLAGDRNFGQEDLVGDTSKVENKVDSSETSLSDLFERSAEEESFTITEEGENEENCVLFKESVAEGTVIFDSTCSSGSEQEVVND